MKKKVQKKLELNKRTISSLDNSEKKEAKGGISALNISCDCNTDHKSCTLHVFCCPPPEEAVLLKEFGE